MKRVVVVNDIHIPFHDIAVVDWAINFIEFLNPHEIVLNGDVVDCYTISAFDRNPLTSSTLLDEIDEARRLMERLEWIPIKWWLGGNHEDRLRRYIWRKAPELGVLPELEFPSLFKLKDHGFKWRNYGEIHKVGKLHVTHGNIARKHSGETARAHFEQFGKSVLVGHTHRLGAFYKTRLGRPYVAFENGCLCRLDPEYLNSPDWQQGLSVVHVEEKTGEFSVQQIPIYRRRNKVTFHFGEKVFGG